MANTGSGYTPLTYASMTPEERARRQAIMDTILEKHERETAARAWFKGKHKFLAEEVEAWDLADRIRRYVAALDERITQGAMPADGYALWRDDSLKVADMLDPSSKRLKPPVLQDAD